MNICFYYPSKRIGGAQLLFIRLADYLSKNTNYEIYYIDYIDGFSKTFIKEASFKYIDFIDNKLTSLPNNSCVIIPASFIFRINKLFTYSTDSFFFVWSIHPSNITSWVDGIRKRLLGRSKRELAGALIKKLYNKGFLYFMDHSNYIAAASFFNFDIPNVQYLQISVEEGVDIKHNFKSKEINETRINIAWLGRLDSDKINSVKIILNEIENNPHRKNIKFYILGSGSELEDLIKCKNNYNFEIEFIGLLFGQKLNDFIYNKLDIGIAMGTSALEIAKMGKPVIMIDLYDKVYKANQMKYVFIHQINNFSLGSIYPFTNNEHRHYYFNEAIDLILNNYETFASSAHKYVVENHSIKIVSELLLKKIENFDLKDCSLHHKILNDLENIYISNENSLRFKLMKNLKSFLSKFHLVN